MERSFHRYDSHYLHVTHESKQPDHQGPAATNGAFSQASNLDTPQLVPTIEQRLRLTRRAGKVNNDELAVKAIAEGHAESATVTVTENGTTAQTTTK